MITVAVGCMRRNGDVLLCQRPAGGAYPLKWEFPGGKLEMGETPEECLKRELMEELGVSAQIGRRLHRQRILYPDSGEFDVIYFAVDAFEGEPRNMVFARICWVTPADLGAYDVLEGNKEMVRLLIRESGEGR